MEVCAYCFGSGAVTIGTLQVTCSHCYGKGHVERVVLTHRVSINRLRLHPVLHTLARKCFPKEQHASRNAAQAQLRSITKRDLEKNTSIHTYRCPDCGAWHVGHSHSKEK